MDVAIIGAGATGLAIAHLLLEQGIRVHVFESAAHEGGLAATYESDGFRFDFGPHEFCTDNPQLIALLEDVCGDDLLRIDKRVSQHFNGRFIGFPFGAIEVLRTLDPLVTARALFEVAGTRFANLFRNPPEGSFEEWTRGRFGRSLYDAYFRPYTEKVWGVDPKLLDAGTARSRISVDSIRDLVKKTLAHHVFGVDDYEKTHSEFRREFFYARGGTGTLHRRLAERVRAAGGEISFGKRLERVVRGSRGIERVGFADGSNHAADYVVSTIPLPALTRICLGVAADPLLAEHSLRFRGMAFVFLRVDRPQVTDNHWIYFPDPAIPFQRLTEFGNFGADMTPRGKTGLALEISMDPGDPAWQTSDAELARQCVQSLERLDLLQPNDVLGFDVVRTRNAYPLQLIGYEDSARALLDALGAIPNLLSVGRQGLFRYCNQNECFEMAFELVPRITKLDPAIRYRRASSWVGVANESCG